MKHLPSIPKILALSWCLWAGVAVQAADIDDWLVQVQEATRGRSYAGTLVVTVGQDMAVSKVWHVCDRTTQVERVDTLSGTPKTTVRRNAQVISFWPEKKVAYTEQRESLGLLSTRLRTNGQSLQTLYRLQPMGTQRVAGHEARVMEIVAKDQARWSYRVWTEVKTGLVIKMQTLDAQGQILEQVAYSDLQMDAPITMAELLQRMQQTEGYTVVQKPLKKTIATPFGQRVPASVLGFQPLSCYQRDEADVAGRKDRIQCVFSDGLATVSVFVEPARAGLTLAAPQAAAGATHAISQVVGTHWVSAMGEVPPQTLQRLTQALVAHP